MYVYIYVDIIVYSFIFICFQYFMHIFTFFEYSNVFYIIPQISPKFYEDQAPKLARLKTRSLMTHVRPGHKCCDRNWLG